MSVLRRIALGFPLSGRTARRTGSTRSRKPGKGPYFIEWDPGSGVYGEDWSGAPRDAKGVLLTGPSAAIMRFASRSSPYTDSGFGIRPAIATRDRIS